MKTGHSLGCNLSAASFCDDAWWDGVFDYLEDRPEIAQRLVLEITETGAFPCEKAALGLVRHLQILGVRVALAGAHGAQGFFIARPSLHGLLDQVVRVEDVLEVLEATEVQDGDELDMALSWSGMERMSALVAASTVSGGAEVSAAEAGMGTGFFLQARA